MPRSMTPQAAVPLPFAGPAMLAGRARAPLHCEAVPPPAPRSTLQWLLWPLLGEMPPPCAHGKDDAMCEECAWHWAIR